MTFEQIVKIAGVLASIGSTISLMLGLYVANKKDYSQAAYHISMTCYLSIMAWKFLGT